jgi:hypothetical protein
MMMTIDSRENEGFFREGSVSKLGKILLGAFTAPKRSSDPYRKEREESKKLAAKHNIEIKRLTGGGFNVWPPKGLEVDPHEGDHFANDWSEVLPLVQDYARVVTNEKSGENHV